MLACTLIQPQRPEVAALRCKCLKMRLRRLQRIARHRPPCCNASSPAHTTFSYRLRHGQSPLLRARSRGPRSACTRLTRVNAQPGRTTTLTPWFSDRQDTQLVRIAPTGGRLDFKDTPGVDVFQSEVLLLHLFVARTARQRRRGWCTSSNSSSRPPEPALRAQVEAFAHVAKTEGERPEVSTRRSTVTSFQAHATASLRHTTMEFKGRSECSANAGTAVVVPQIPLVALCLASASLPTCRGRKSAPMPCFKPA